MDKGIDDLPPLEARPHWSKTYRRQLIGLGALLLVLAGVIFVLPQMVAPVEKAKVADAVQPAKPTAKLESPWRDAQLAKVRREAQDILSPMLALQQQLEDKSVQRWAADAYERALATAMAADADYRQREFSDAKAKYQLAHEKFQTLLTQSAQVLSDTLRQGQTAIEAGDAAQALAAFDLALAIDAQNSDAQQGQARAQVLEQVLGLLRKGELLQQSGFLEQAQAEYRQAQSLDAVSPPVQQKLADVKQAILERDFTEAMSAGYSALNAGNFNKARQSFKRAQGLKPGAGEVNAALTQTDNRQTQQQIQQLLSQATQHERNEQWQPAADAFGKALALDSSLVKARIGQIRTQARADFDGQILAILDKPERLASDAVYRQAQQLHADARAMQNPGPRLQRQALALAEQLQLAVTPVPVRLQSDNATDVTLYRVGHLGQFAQRDMSLKPGRYTAVGTRLGYRDVRQEFTVSPLGGSQQTIVIQCVEPIASEG